MEESGIEIKRREREQGKVEKMRGGRGKGDSIFPIMKLKQFGLKKLIFVDGQNKNSGTLLRNKQKANKNKVK